VEVYLPKHYHYQGPSLVLNSVKVAEVSEDEGMSKYVYQYIFM
jgi:hypothetical protein